MRSRRRDRPSIPVAAAPVRRAADVVVIGAGIVGAACAYELARRGAGVVVVERAAIAAGSTGAGEGNVLLSDRRPGPELELGRVSSRRWIELAGELDDDFELDRKGGVVCASTPAQLAVLRALGAEQVAAGIQVEPVAGEALWALEPALDRTLAGGAHYPEDLQIQPVRAAAALLRGARAHGATVLTGVEVQGIERDALGAVAAVVAGGTRIATPVAVNAAGALGARVAGLAGSSIPIAPRRGVVLVTEPLPPTVFHKVYAAGYVDTVASGDAALQVSAVVEDTPGGTILIGASRELVGFDRAVGTGVLQKLAAAATALFPVLAGVRAMRAYRGFRPFSPDHLPLIGEDPVVAGLWHACGHEGAGIALAPATAQLIAAGVLGPPAPVDARPFSPARFGPAERAA
jgi:glycine/D-amino acid oxidase-like deaminating enzyme